MSQVRVPQEEPYYEALMSNHQGFSFMVYSVAKRGPANLKIAFFAVLKSDRMLCGNSYLVNFFGVILDLK